MQIRSEWDEYGQISDRKKKMDPMEIAWFSYMVNDVNAQTTDRHKKMNCEIFIQMRLDVFFHVLLWN